MDKDIEVLEDEKTNNPKQKPKKKKSKLGKICSIISNVLIIPIIIITFLCAILTFTAKANNKVPSIFGMSIVTVLTNSMEPVHKVGDVLVIKQVNLNDIKVGDDLAFYGPTSTNNPLFVQEIDGVKYSKVILHRVVRIIYVDPAEIGIHSDDAEERIRLFVCKGINTSEPTYYEVEEGEKGNYNKDANGEYFVQEGGPYQIRLENLGNKTEEELGKEDIDHSNMDTMQYITDDLVVGVYDKGISPAIGGFITFCGSTQGLLCLVIVPALILTIITIIGLTKEVKEVKEEDKKEREVLEGNLNKIKETHTKGKDDVKQDEAENQDSNTNKVNVSNIIGSVVSDEQNKEDASGKDTSKEPAQTTQELKEDETKPQESPTKLKEEKPKQNKEVKSQPAKQESEKPQEQPNVTKVAPKKVAPPKTTTAKQTKANESAKEQPQTAEKPAKVAPKKVPSVKVEAQTENLKTVKTPPAKTEPPKVAPKTAPKTGETKAVPKVAPKTVPKVAPKAKVSEKPEDAKTPKAPPKKAPPKKQ